MIRRILVAGGGGLAGLAVWFAFAYFLFHTFHVSIVSRVGPIVRVLGCGVLVLSLGEKLRLIPSQEQVDQQCKPVSLFAAHEQNVDPTRTDAERSPQNTAL